MDSLDDSYLLTGYEPKNYDLMETTSGPPQIPWSTHSYPSKGCLSVSRRRPCPKERGDRDLLWQKVKN